MKTNDIKQRIREYFFLHPTIKLRVRQIEREIGAPLPSVIRYTKELEKEKILGSTVIAGVKMYSADRASPLFLLEKKLYNVRLLFTSGLVDFLVKEYSNPPILVFGSYSRGEDIEKSDVDLYVETPQKKKRDVSSFEKKLHRKIQFFCYSSLKDVENKELANNIVNGIVVNGYVEVFS